MALYFYRALARDGQRVSGQLDAASLQNAKELLTKRNLYPVVIESLENRNLGLPWYQRLWQRNTVTAKDLILFTKQFAVLLRSGVPVLQLLELMAEQFTGQLHLILVALRDGIKEGKSLADGLEKYPQVFSTIYVQLVRAGEATGNLEMILDRLTIYLEERQKLRKKIISTLSTPMIQLVLVVLVTIVLLTTVVPSLAQTFTQEGRELPLPTRILLAISGALTGHYILLLSFIVLSLIIFSAWHNTPRGAYLFDKFKLKIPVIGFFVRMGAVVQFSRTLGMLTDGGVTLAEALDIVCKIVSNKFLAESLMEARDNIIKEGRIAQYLKRTQVFPSIAIYLIKTGEESGELGPMLTTVAENYEEELTEYADKLSSALEPIMMIVMAAVIGFIVLSIMLPMMDQVNIADVQRS